MDSVRIELDPFRASDGTALFRRRFRPAAAPIGDLLLGHGIGEDSSRYIQAARAFAEAGWQTVSWDLRGHGRSDGPRGYVARWSRYHDDLSEQVDALRTRTVRRPATDHLEPPTAATTVDGGECGLDTRHDAVTVDDALAAGGDMLDDEERARLHASIERGLADVQAGRTVEASVVLERLRSRARK